MEIKKIQSTGIEIPNNVTCTRVNTGASKYRKLQLPKQKADGAIHRTLRIEIPDGAGGLQSGVVRVYNTDKGGS
jgi:hypothetical protein